jgi:hypothetical protein
VIESSVLSICRESSAGADDLDAYGEAFGITLVSRGRDLRDSSRGPTDD